MPLPAFCAPAALRVRPCSCDSPALPSSQVTSPTPFPLPVPCHPCRLSPIPVPRTGPFSCLGGPAEAVPCLEHLSSLCTGQAPLFLPCSACPGSPPSSSPVFPSVYCRGGTCLKSDLQIDLDLIIAIGFNNGLKCHRGSDMSVCCSDLSQGRAQHLA